MNPNLKQAVAIFTELGWADATVGQALSLPLGTPEQHRKALAGLKNGEWGEITQLSENSWGWRSFLDVDLTMLGIFAIRLGVDARRAGQVMPSSRSLPDELAAKILAERDPVFAQNFIKYACTSRHRSWEHSTTAYAGAVVRLVAHLELPVPENAEYLKDWAAFAAAVLGAEAEIVPKERGLPEESVIKDRFAEHVHSGVALGVAATGPFGAVIPAGVRRGWLTRGEAVELAFAALDASGRPGDRKVWVQVLDQLGLADAELTSRSDALIPTLATGDAYLIERIAPTLIANVDDDSLIEVLLTSLAARTKKTRLTVLKAAAARPRPDRVDELSTQLLALAADRDRAISRIAKSIVKDWALEADPEPAQTQIQGWWQATPPLWTVPSFVRGEVTPQALTDLAAELFGRDGHELVADVAFERFRAVLNALARKDPSSAKAALGGIRAQWTHSALGPVVDWVKGETPKYEIDAKGQISDVFTARDYELFPRLGQVPCWLSEPSTVDLAITPTDFISRLELYLAQDAYVSEADLLLALTRIDLALVTPVTLKALKRLKVRVLLHTGKFMKDTAGPIARKYLADPVPEPKLVLSERWQNWWENAPIAMPKSLNMFPPRLVEKYSSPLYSIFPSWGDASLRAVHWDSEVQREIGLVLRQVARRAKPLPSGGAINFLASQRSFHPVAAQDATLAVTEAWERGLLRPGVADVTYLDWHNSPSTLALLTKALVEIAQTGIASVVWPILDDLITASLKQPRLLAGTAELVEAIALLLPEVLAAVADGRAEAAALDLPGTRALAARSGSSRAVGAAREVVSQLPKASAPTPAQVLSSKPKLELPFEEVWPKNAGLRPAIPDGVTVTADWANPDSPTRILAFNLVLPDEPGRSFQVMKKDWIYDLEREGTCQAEEILSADIQAKREIAWLHWDVEQTKLVATAHRNWVQNTDGPLSRADIVVPPLSDSLITVSLGLLSNDGDGALTGMRLLRHLTDNNLLGSAAVTQAVRALLKSPAVSMAKLVHPLEKNARYLPILWPLLTEPIRAVGASPTPFPTWLNRVLDVALLYAPYLAEATSRGLINAEASSWPGLAELAARPGNSKAIAKAQLLLSCLKLK